MALLIRHSAVRCSHQTLPFAPEGQAAGIIGKFAGLGIAERLNRADKLQVF
jgi:hypothetical protein